MTLSNAEVRHLPFPSQAQVILDKLEHAFKLAETHSETGSESRFNIIGTERVDPQTNQVVPMLWTINLTDPGELQFAQNVSAIIKRGITDSKVRERLPGFIEWLGGLG